MAWPALAGAGGGAAAGGAGSAWATFGMGAAAQGGMGLGQKLWNRSSATRAWQRQQKFLKQQQAYTTHMSNTAWQRGVADMRKAGINPLLAASQGGASTPGGGGGGVSQDAPHPGADLMGAALARASMDKIRQETNTGRSLQEATDALTALRKEQTRALELAGAVGSTAGDAFKGVKGPAVDTWNRIKHAMQTGDIYGATYNSGKEVGADRDRSRGGIIKGDTMIREISKGVYQAYKKRNGRWVEDGAPKDETYFRSKKQ